MTFSIWSSQIHQSIHINSQCKTAVWCIAVFLLLDFGLDLLMSALCFLTGNRFSSGLYSTICSHFNLLGCRVNFTTLVTRADPELDFRGP